MEIRTARMFIVPLFCGMTSVVCFDAKAYAGVLYSTSYEAPDYSVGALSGQEGWLNSFDIDPVVTSGFARTGSQSLEVRQAVGENPFGLTFRAGPYSTSAPMVSVKHSIYLDGTDGWASPSTFLSPMALIGENGFVSQLAVRDGNRVEFGGGVADIETDRWIDLKLVLDFQTQTSNAFVDGSFIGSETFDNPATELVQVEIFHIFDNTTFNSPGLSSSFFVDDLSIKINSVPEPGTILGLFAIGGLGFATKLKKQA
ncbi:PEP-CTERM sorting domain-containing protein [Crocosphaera chwakensis]|uniref:Ice-binding protein C-terminal domain-containing protein n=1 Tax=Crocosphaera chwakensis CCY0110 TaxID=391612 RepID=A3IS17_9CHRO|nr:PEP-CTERM sorting domain-containing protein [Crocosphaera chwakensis]EAZ90695.1 hypothetical protein CY0110_32145 [Crocosphaera chwakensis CCY0110]